MEMDIVTLSSIIGGTIAATGAVCGGIVKVMKGKGGPTGFPAKIENVTIHGNFKELPRDIENRLVTVEGHVKELRQDFKEEVAKSGTRYEKVLEQLSGIREDIAGMKV